MEQGYEERPSPPIGLLPIGSLENTNPRPSTAFTVAHSSQFASTSIIREEATCELFPTEHVMARSSARQGVDAQTLILKAIEKKRKKGDAAYASGKTLVVLLDLDGAVLFPNSVARSLPDPLHFATVWVVCFLKRSDNGEYIYDVTHLDVSEGDAPTFRVRIATDFDDWEVMGVQ